MREPGAVLLVATYELGQPPLAVAWPAAFLEARGFRPAVLDVSVEPFDAGRVARARLVVISVPMHTALRIGVTVARRVRAVNPRAHICLVGLYAHLNADWLLAEVADSVAAGEAEAALVALAEALEAGGGRLAGAAIPGIRTRAHAALPVLDRLAFPVPSRGGLPPLGRYAHLDHDGQRRLAGRVEASRGCRHRCRHCPIPAVYGGRFFVVPREVVLADVARLVQAGATHVTFGDPDFLNGPRHALEVARALHGDFPRLTFDVTAKVTHLLRHRGLLPELARLGCLFVVTAVESLSDVVLRHLGKGHTGTDVRAVLRLARETGLAVRPTWVAFTPWTTLADYRAMLDLVEAEALVDHVDPVQYALRLLVPPGSLLAEDPAFLPHRGALVPEAFAYPWTHPDPRMDRLQGEVASAVAEAAAGEAEEGETFARVRALADGADGVGASPSGRGARARPAAHPRRPARLTEAWFC
jgi:radical SAM superfamily enzyme YgiQ (UPF0313 family)